MEHSDDLNVIKNIWLFLGSIPKNGVKNGMKITFRTNSYQNFLFFIEDLMKNAFLNKIQ